MSTFYTRKTGSNGNPGTTGSPKLTITGASGGISLLSAGDTLMIGDGTYDEQILNTIPGGSSGLPTILQAENRNLAILLPTSPTPGFAVINVDESYVTFDGLVCDATNCQDNGGWYMDNDAAPTHITIKNGTARNGINVASGPSAEPNGILGSDNGDYLTVQNMDVHDFRGHGIYANSPNSLIENNRVRDWVPQATLSNYGIQVQVNSGNNVVRYNTVYNVSNGIIIANGSNDLVYANVVYNNVNEGIAIRYDSASAGIYNNTCYGNGNYGINVNGNGGAPTDTVVGNNILFENGLSGVGDTATGTIEFTNFTGDPDFEDSASGDFHIHSDSDCVQAGTFVATVTEDFDGVSYLNPPSIGAYEVPPPVAAGQTAVRSSRLATAASGTAVSILAPAATATGDLVIIAIHTNGLVTHVDNNGATPFTEDLTEYQGSGSASLSVWSRRIVPGDPGTYNFTIGSSQRWTIIAVTFQNPHPFTIYDVVPAGNVASAAGVDTSASAPSITTVTDEAIHCAVMGTDGPANSILSTPSGYTSEENAGEQATAFVTDVISPPAATGTATFTWTSGSEYETVSFAIKNYIVGGSVGTARIIIGGLMADKHAQLLRVL